MKKTGIRDLARECGVSKSAVARVLNNQPGVAPEIRKLVLEFARSMNYRNMSHGHFPVVAVLVSGFHYGFYRSRIEQNVREELHRNGCRSLIVTDCDLALLSETVIDGVISICYDDRIAKIWGNLKIYLWSALTTTVVILMVFFCTLQSVSIAAGNRRAFNFAWT